MAKPADRSRCRSSSRSSKPHGRITPARRRSIHPRPRPRGNSLRCRSTSTAAPAFGSARPGRLSNISVSSTVSCRTRSIFWYRPTRWLRRAIRAMARCSCAVRAAATTAGAATRPKAAITKAARTAADFPGRLYRRNAPALLGGSTLGSAPSGRPEWIMAGPPARLLVRFHLGACAAPGRGPSSGQSESS